MLLSGNEQEVHIKDLKKNQTSQPLKQEVSIQCSCCWKPSSLVTFYLVVFQPKFDHVSKVQFSTFIWTKQSEQAKQAHSVLREVEKMRDKKISPHTCIG